jgi:hypothetical protein
LDSISVICKRRKKREILQDFSEQSPRGDPIEPSEPQQSVHPLFSILIDRNLT